MLFHQSSLNLFSISNKAFYEHILRSIEAERLGAEMIVSF